MPSTETTSPPSRRRPGRSRSSTRHAGLDREVVDAALRIVEQGGGSALSMRRLAAELGVTTTTIYWHVGSRDELVLAVVQRLAEQIGSAPVAGTTPRRRVLSAARNIWTNALAHRNVTALANEVGATTLLELPLEATLVAELEAAGVRGAKARDALRALLGCIAGFLVLAWRDESAVPPELRANVLWAQLDDDRVSEPTRAALAEAVDLDALFDRTVGAVVDAFVPAGRGGQRR